MNPTTPNNSIGGYRLRSALHTGATSQVYEVIEPASGQHRAMKLLLPEAAGNEEHRQMLFYEAEVGMKLVHENIVRIFKVSKDEHAPHFIMEFFPAGSLRQRLMDKDADFIREFGTKFIKQAAVAFAYMHAKGFVHRDIKPDNMIVNSAGDLKVIDFAISKAIPTGFSRWFYRKKKPQGTRSYMSPQQILDEMPDPRDDIYSFGVTLYELFVGKVPFVGKDMQDLLTKHFTEKPMAPKLVNAQLTDEFSDMLVKMLEKKREKRHANMHEVLQQLRTLRIYKVGTGPKKKPT